MDEVITLAVYRDGCWVGFEVIDGPYELLTVHWFARYTKSQLKEYKPEDLVDEYLGSAVYDDLCALGFCGVEVDLIWIW